jgi:hypothetical protein
MVVAEMKAPTFWRTYVAVGLAAGLGAYIYFVESKKPAAVEGEKKKEKLFTFDKAKVQQNIPVLNVPNPTITTTNDLSNPSISDSWVDNPSSSNATLPLMPREIARVSFRLVKIGPTRSQNQDAAFELGSNGVKTVAISPSITIVPIPVVIDTLELPDATAGQSYSFALLASALKRCTMAARFSSGSSGRVSLAATSGFLGS